MQVGKLDQRIVLQSYSEVNVRGELQKIYSTEETVWGHVISQRGNEAFEASRLNATDIIRVMIRYRDDIDTTWRVQWMGVDYYVETLDKTARRDGYLWFTARAKTL